MNERANDVDRQVGRRADEDEPVAPPTGSLEDEGIPDHVGPLASKDATGDGQEGVTAPGDAPWAADDDAVTVEGQREGSTLDERLAMEEPERSRPGDQGALEIVDADRPDDEPTLVGDAADVEDTAAPEERAMHVRDGAPGATEDDSDGYVDEDRA